MHQAPRCRCSFWSYDCHVLTVPPLPPTALLPSTAANLTSSRGLPTSVLRQKYPTWTPWFLSAHCPVSPSLPPSFPSPQLAPNQDLILDAFLFLICCAPSPREFRPLRSQCQFRICSLPWVLGQATAVPPGWLQVRWTPCLCQLPGIANVWLPGCPGG